MMVKIKMYDVETYEEQFIKDWVQAHDVEVDYEHGPLTKENVEDVKGYDGISLSHNGPFDSDLFEILASYGIKQIAQRSAGFDMYDLEKAKANGILITTVPSYSPSSIAEYAVMGALYFVRQVPLAQQRVQAHDFRWKGDIMSRTVKDLTVAVIGVGRIGSISARLFHSFGCRVVGYDLVRRPEMEDIVDYKESMLDAITQADIVTLHIPGNKETYHLFDDEVFRHFKAQTIFVNAARGMVVDTQAFLKALDSEKIAGAVIDTYENEAEYYRRDYSGKVIQDEVLLHLIERDDVLVSPHIAFFTGEAVKNLTEGGLNSTLEVLNTGDSEFRIN
ncbi:D-specific D-2-hydroxyacid dehydrogenase [Staphylococcus piscifermentans]|nr:D-specific D-2-hydroxyacid dehydrogenase [Staphylococcus piscifermentans]